MTRDVFFKDVFNTCHELELFPLRISFIPTENIMSVLLVDDATKQNIKLHKTFDQSTYVDGDVRKCFNY